MVATSRTAASTWTLLQKQSHDISGSSSSSTCSTGSGSRHSAAAAAAGILKLQASLGNGGSSTSPPSPSSSSSTLRGKSIPLTGLFAKRGHPSIDVTPAIGTEFERDSGLSLTRIIDEQDDDAIRELASLVSHRGVVFVRNQPDLTPDHLARLADKIGSLSGRPKSSGLHIHPLSSDFSESGDYIGKGEKIDSEPDATGRQISFEDEKSTFASAGWHTDISFEPVPSDYAMLQLRVIPPNGGGDTMWSSMYSAYDALSKPMQTMLEGLTATHDADMFREQAARYGFKLYSKARGHPDNIGDRLRTSHPVIRTNPVTGWKGLYVNRSFTKRINELSPDESEVLLKFLFSLVAENFNYQCRFRWQQHDIAIWDNRSTQHSGIFDFGKQKRTGDRCCSLGEKPYLDPHSSSRKEQLAKSA